MRDGAAVGVAQLVPTWNFAARRIDFIVPTRDDRYLSIDPGIPRQAEPGVTTVVNQAR